jgi:ribosomal protein S18 acetylase RimI-like enzyme
MSDSKTVKIVTYQEKYKDFYKSLNQEWIDKYFHMEEEDILKLNNPEQIISEGGAIHFALKNAVPVGVCSLVKLKNHTYDYELSKMGVTARHQGRGIGRQLAQSMIEVAQVKGAKTIFLESNRILTPALTLYRSLGFKELEQTSSVYSRSDIQMVLNL